ncbi:hypothetical protein [Candidatus Thiodiazotropha sp. CDECU1]|uniref:hypothetical protein n=1 Tax=Candidatus Thiodiazotropha sp. CDECU1 TaxID=3065865 RepID=UPI00292ED68E|nr:hypothetical protein [Candidatus Thiodiazotropha sp. CDECU1]
MTIETAGDTLLLFPRQGSPNEWITDSAFNTAWQRLRARIKAAGSTPFQFKDIRAKHASDLESDDDATEQLMQSGKQVTRRHNRRRPKKLFNIR